MHSPLPLLITLSFQLQQIPHCRAASISVMFYPGIVMVLWPVLMGDGEHTDLHVSAPSTNNMIHPVWNLLAVTEADINLFWISLIKNVLFLGYC